MPQSRETRWRTQEVSIVLRVEGLQQGDIAWPVIDVDSRAEPELMQLIAWGGVSPQFNVAISNPKFELFLVLHFGNGLGCTSPNAEQFEQKLIYRTARQEGQYKQFSRL